MSVLSIKVPIQKKSGNLFNDPRNIVEFSVRDEYTNCYPFEMATFWQQKLINHNNNKTKRPKKTSHDEEQIW